MDEFDAYIEQLQSIISEQIDSIWASYGTTGEEEEEEEREKEEPGLEKTREKEEGVGENETHVLHEAKQRQEGKEIEVNETSGRKEDGEICSKDEIKMEERVEQEQLEFTKNIQSEEQTTEQTTLDDGKHRKRENGKEKRKERHKEDPTVSTVTMETSIVGELLEDIWNRKEGEMKVKTSKNLGRKERVRKVRREVKPNGNDGLEEISDGDDDVFLETDKKPEATTNSEIERNNKDDAIPSVSESHGTRQVHQDPTTFLGGTEKKKHKEKKSRDKEVKRTRGGRGETKLVTTNHEEFLRVGTEQEESDPRSGEALGHSASFQSQRSSQEPLQRSTLPRAPATSSSVQETDQISSTLQPPCLKVTQLSHQPSAAQGRTPPLDQLDTTSGEDFPPPPREFDQKTTLSSTSLPKACPEPTSQVDLMVPLKVDPVDSPLVDQSALPQSDRSVLSQMDQSALPQEDQSALPQADPSPLPQMDSAVLPQLEQAAVPQAQPTGSPLYVDLATIIRRKAFRKIKETAAPPSTPQQLPEEMTDQPSLPLQQLDAQLRMLFSLTGDVKTCPTTPPPTTVAQEPLGAILGLQTPDGVSPDLEKNLLTPSRSPDFTCRINTDTEKNHHNQITIHQNISESPPLDDLPLPSPPPSPPLYSTIEEEPLPPTPPPPPFPLPSHFYCPVAEEPPPSPSTPQAIPRSCSLSEGTPSQPLYQDPPPPSSIKVVALTLKTDPPTTGPTAAPPRRKTPPPKPPRIKCSPENHASNITTSSPGLKTSHSPTRKLSLSPSTARRHQSSSSLTPPTSENTEPRCSPSSFSQENSTLSDLQSSSEQPQCYYLSPSPLPPDSYPSSPSTPDQPKSTSPSSPDIPSTSRALFDGSRSPSSLPSSPLLTRQRTSPSPISPRVKGKLSSLMRPKQLSSSLKEKTSPPPPERKLTSTSSTPLTGSSSPVMAKLEKKRSSPLEEVRREGSSRFFIDSSKAISEEILSKLEASRQRGEDVDSFAESPKSLLEALNSPLKSHESQTENSFIYDEISSSCGESPKPLDKISRSLPESPDGISQSLNLSTSEEGRGGGGGGGLKVSAEYPGDSSGSPKSPESPLDSPRSTKSRGSEKPKFSFGSLGRKLSLQKAKKPARLEIGYPTNFQHVLHVDRDNPVKYTEPNTTKKED